MDCPKCGYERQADDSHCQMCGLDFAMWEGQVEEKKRLKERVKTYESTRGEFKVEGAEPAVALSSRSSPAETIGECPKCRYPRKAGARECPHCGVIYERHEQLLARKKVEEAAKQQELEKRFAEERARVQREAEKAIAEERIRRRKSALEKKVEKTVAEPTIAPEKTPKLEKTPIRMDQVKARFHLIYSKRWQIFQISGMLCVLILFCWLGVTWYANWAEKMEQMRLIMQKEETRKRLAEEHQRIAAEFSLKEEEILIQLRSLIDNRNFELFNQEIQHYDIPPLAEKLAAIKKYRDEIMLFDSTKSIPANDFSKNYEAFFQLNQMNPENKDYTVNMLRFRKLYADQQYEAARQYLNKRKSYRNELRDALTAVGKAIELEGLQDNYRKLRYALQQAELLFFEGNDKIQMALRDDGLTQGATGGQRKIYVWIKNIGTMSFFVNVDYFTLITEKDHTFSYNNCSRELLVDLQPGEQVQGYVYFYTAEKPKEMIFAHINAGTIARRFPEP